MNCTKPPSSVSFRGKQLPDRGLEASAWKWQCSLLLCSCNRSARTRAMFSARGHIFSVSTGSSKQPVSTWSDQLACRGFGGDKNRIERTRWTAGESGGRFTKHKLLVLLSLHKATPSLGRMKFVYAWDIAERLVRQVAFWGRTEGSPCRA